MYRRCLIFSFLSSFYIVAAQSLSCQSCSSSLVCQLTTCVGNTCYIVSMQNTWINGCTDENVPTTVNGSSVGGVCYTRADGGRLCVCRSKECNTLFDADTFPKVEQNPSTTLDIDRQLEVARQTTTPSPVSTPPPGATTVAPETTTKASNAITLPFPTAVLATNHQPPLSTAADYESSADPQNITTDSTEQLVETTTKAVVFDFNLEYLLAVIMFSVV